MSDKLVKVKIINFIKDKPLYYFELESGKKGCTFDSKKLYFRPDELSMDISSVTKKENIDLTGLEIKHLRDKINKLKKE